MTVRRNISTSSPQYISYARNLKLYKTTGMDNMMHSILHRLLYETIRRIQRRCLELQN